MTTGPYVDYVAIATHRILAGHRPFETCPDCPPVPWEEF